MHSRSSFSAIFRLVIITGQGGKINTGTIQFMVSASMENAWQKAYRKDGTKLEWLDMSQEHNGVI